MAIDGTYQGVAKSMMGSADCTIELKTDGATLSGKASMMGIESEIQNGTATDDSFDCQVEGDGPLGHMVLDIKGKVNGDTIKGTIKTGRIKARFEGKRVD